jgi:Polyketide cyclase / dehydrase and lipid transport
MVRIDGEILINRPVDAVFDFVADERNEPRYNPRMLRVDKLSPGPIGLGSRFHAEMTSRPRPAEMTIEWTGYDRPRRLASWTQLSTMEIRGALTFDPVPEGTRMRWSWVVKPRGVFKLLTPLVARTGRRQEQAIWANLKRVLEAQQAPSATAGR